MKRFYIHILFLAAFFMGAQTFSQVPRALLFPASEIHTIGPRTTHLKERLPAGTIQSLSSWGDGHFICTLQAGETYQSQIYYGTNDTLARVTSENNFFPRAERNYGCDDSLHIIFSCTRDPRGLVRDFFDFSTQTRQASIIAENFDGLTLDQLQHPIAGLRNLGNGHITAWVKLATGWQQIDQVVERGVFFDPAFHYDSMTHSLHYANTHGLHAVDLQTGQLQVVLPTPFNIQRTYYPAWGSFQCYVDLGGYFYRHKGRKYWAGSALFNQQYQSIHQQLRARFPNQKFSIESLYGSSDQPWRLQLVLEQEPDLSCSFDPQTNVLTFEDDDQDRLSLRSMQHLMSKKQYRTLQLPEGLEIPYFLSLPTTGNAPYPAVMMAHGGPHVEYQFGYDPEVQHLTGLGYAVIQPNYRGSTSNLQLFDAGFGEWGQGMQRDLTAVAEALINEGTITADQIAISGFSYGGYAALVAATVGEFVTSIFPGFKCAISLCGPFNLQTMLQTSQQESGYQPDHPLRSMAPSIAPDGTISPQEEERLTRLSPLTHASNLHLPLLLMQGANDIRVPRRHADIFSAAAHAAGHEHTYVLFEGEEHGLEQWPNLRAAACLVERFLARHLTGGTVEEPRANEFTGTTMQVMSVTPELRELAQHIQSQK